MSYKEKNVCKIVERIRKEADELRQENGLLTVDDMEEFAIKFLDAFDTAYYPTEIDKIVDELGFSVFSTTAFPEHLFGVIGVNERYKEKFKNEKVIVLNKKENLGHRRFTASHEIAHYLFDYNGNNEFYYEYNTNISGDYREILANRFAAAILMRRDVFIDRYKRYMKQYDDIFQTKELLAKDFGVSKRAVQLRIEECGLDSHK